MTLGMTVEDLVFKKGDGKNFDPPGAGFNTQKVGPPATSGSASTLRRCLQARVEDRLVHDQAEHSRVPHGSQRQPIKCPSQIDFPQISIYVPETDVQRSSDHFASAA